MPIDPFKYVTHWAFKIYLHKMYLIEISAVVGVD